MHLIWDLALRILAAGSMQARVGARMQGGPSKADDSFNLSFYNIHTGVRSAADAAARRR
jgi:hypothetical protein